MFHQWHFRYPWRAYQQRVLEQLPLFRQDRQVHIVAPPGAGKTVLGLEIIRQCATNTLVLVPSLAIRTQWVERLQQDFLAGQVLSTDFLSHQLRAPRTLTITTYQALHAYLKEQEASSLSWVKLLVVDECHHLRREWWRSLQQLAKTVAPERLALTATPPFDVSGLEWQRYQAFCGEIDEQISLPELVAAGDLCFHQDYIYPLLPNQDIIEKSQLFNTQKQQLYALLADLRPLAQYLLHHPWLAKPEEHYEAIFEQPQYFSALLVVLGHLGSEPPATALGILHGELTIAPPLNDEWLSVFLQKALRADPYLQHGRPNEILQPIRRQLSAMGAWNQGKIQLQEPVGIQNELRNNQAKIQAVSDIVAHEWEQMGESLRLVVLSDFIYPELLPTTAYDRSPLTKIGISTLFEQLRRDGLDDGDRALQLALPVAPNRLGVLTGSIVLVPKAALPALQQIAAQSLPDFRLKAQALFPDAPYYVLQADSASSKYLVAWITALFTDGHINVLIGTKSLLGEGWDAPAINSLILASTVGSFVLSNQMRGRAIRTNPAIQNKTANIWHPVAINPALANGGADLAILRRRFQAFAGPSLQGEAIISNSLDRFSFHWETADAPKIQRFAQEMLERSARREDLATRWSSALTKGAMLVEAITPPNAHFYRQEDKLGRHYAQATNRAQIKELDLFKMVWKAATVPSFALACLLGFLLPPASFFAPLSLLLLGGASFFISQRLGQLRRQRSQLGFTKADYSLPNRSFYFFPLLLSLPLLFFSPAMPLVFFAILSLFLLSQLPGKKSSQAQRRFELITNPKERLVRYGTALLHALQAARIVKRGENIQLRIEQDHEHYLAYLANADHHDVNAFADSMQELLLAVDNQRWLLRLRAPEAWQEGIYYLAVPHALAKKKESAEYLRQALEKELGLGFDLIFTRDPIGRQHLLSAKLDLANFSQNRQAKRAVLWR